MSNQCITTYVAYSRNKAYVKNLHYNIQEIIKDKENNSVKRLAIRCGFLNDSQLCVNKADYFDSCDADIICKESVYSFQFTVISNWSPNPYVFFAIAKENYKLDLDFSFIAEEPGLDGFHIWDETGVWFRTKFRLSYSINGACNDHYFEFYADVIDHINSAFPLAKVSLYDSISNVVGRVNNAYEESDDYFFCLNAFEPFVNPYIDFERKVA